MGSDELIEQAKQALAAGDSVVVANTFILKSELEKGEVRDED